MKKSHRRLAEECRDKSRAALDRMNKTGKQLLKSAFRFLVFCLFLTLDAFYVLSLSAMASMNSQELAVWVLKPGSTRPVKSVVIVPDFIVSRLAFSSLSAKLTSSGRLSSSPRFFSAPVQAKIVAIGFVEGFSPLIYL